MHLIIILIFLSAFSSVISGETNIESKTDFYKASAYQIGEGVQKNEFKAFLIFHECAKNGDPKAMYKVAMCFFNGVGIEKDQVEGLAWMYNAVNSGIISSAVSSMENAMDSLLIEKAKQRANQQISTNSTTSSTILADDKTSKPIFPKPIHEISEREYWEYCKNDLMTQLIKTRITKSGFGKYPWHRNISASSYYIGVKILSDNPEFFDSNNWYPNLLSDYGGRDDPHNRDAQTYAPKSFEPKLNPFYVNLPYNDIENGKTKASAYSVIPWLPECFTRSGESVLKGRWIAIHHNGRTCFAQWIDCPPPPADNDWEYVFGGNRPRREIGITFSPAVLDFLGKPDSVDWKFVDSSSVPNGPWKYYGNNNTFFLMRRGLPLEVYDRNNYIK